MHKIIGLKDKFNHGVGSQQFHYKQNGLTVENLLPKILEFVNDK